MSHHHRCYRGWASESNTLHSSVLEPSDLAEARARSVTLWHTMTLLPHHGCMPEVLEECTYRGSGWTRSLSLQGASKKYEYTMNAGKNFIDK